MAFRVATIPPPPPPPPPPPYPSIPEEPKVHSGRYSVIRPPMPPLDVKSIPTDIITLPDILPIPLPGKPERLTVKPPSSKR
jgi:hypothetical protein